MDGQIEIGLRAVAIGVGATATMDLCGWMLSRIAGLPLPNYGLVGRWVGWMAKGRFRHDSIGATPSLATERVIGWVTHYAVGVIFASALLLVWSPSWACRPSLGPALAVGVVSVAAPFLLMQPAMGAGVAASRTPDPRTARLRSLTNHLLFGVGLWVAGHVASLVMRC